MSKPTDSREAVAKPATPILGLLSASADFLYARRGNEAVDHTHPSPEEDILNGS